MKSILCSLFLAITLHTFAQTSVLTPEKLWSLGRVSFQKMSADGSILYYGISTPDMTENKSKTKFYAFSNATGTTKEVTEIPSTDPIDEQLENALLSPDKKIIAFTKEVNLQHIHGDERYPELNKSNVLVYDDLCQRHWDTWEDGNYSHLFVGKNNSGKSDNARDIMLNELFDCPQKPHGGPEDFCFSPDGKTLLYVCKKKTGKEYALSTNTDIYAYDNQSQLTTNLTEEHEGYDTNPQFSRDGHWMAWLSMPRDGFEADKNELWLMDWSSRKSINLTADWDESVGSFSWSENGNALYFIAAFHGTEQLFKLSFNDEGVDIKQITKGAFDVNGICAQHGNTMYVSRCDMNHATEIYSVNLDNGNMTQISHANDEAYSHIPMCSVQERYTSLENGEKLFSWVIYPPDFDSSKKYPTLLYCQGGPQSALTQFYSFRWNFQLMASQGYIVIAPNRTGMPGWGTKWNEDISKDWGGNPMRDYLAAIDDISEEPYVDRNRLGAVGASYGGYSVYMLAGIHENRFKTFIAHCGLFDLKSWYGTTEELWFANWDIGGPYWDKSNKEAKHSYQNFSPSNYVDNWNTPILIYQGGKDFRVPIEQGLQAFQAAKLKGLKSRFVLLPEENHWVMKPQNGLVWQREFFSWLKETL